MKSRTEFDVVLFSVVILIVLRILPWYIAVPIGIVALSLPALAEGIAKGLRR